MMMNSPARKEANEDIFNLRHSRKTTSGNKNPANIGNILYQIYAESAKVLPMEA